MTTRKMCLCVIGFALMVGMTTVAGCSKTQQIAEAPQARSGVKTITPEVEVGSDGLTNEQRNIRDRLKMDNKPGAIKHLYVISPVSGQCLLYSTVRGKVTSSGKRLSPLTVAAGLARGSDWSCAYGIPVKVGGKTYRTTEVPQDDGTYGQSNAYLFWFTASGVYHQHYLVGNEIVHVSSEPIAVRSVLVNLELRHTTEDAKPNENKK